MTEYKSVSERNSVFDRVMLDSMRRDLESMLNPGYGKDTSDRGMSQNIHTPARNAVKHLISTSSPDQNFDDVFSNEEALLMLRQAIEGPVKHKSLYEAYGLKMPKGVLLSGPPGCGKTMFARAACSEIRCLYGKETEMIIVSGPELQTMYVGQTEKKIKAIFTYANEYKTRTGIPLLVFIDEADAILPDRTGRYRRVHSFEESQVAAFLAEMDGVNESSAFVMLATNRPEAIDQAVLRDGRCDLKIIVKKPDKDAVEMILTKKFRGTTVDADVDTLVFAALEGLFDPHKVILSAHALGIDEGKLKDLKAKAFTMEHIVSGAMAAGLPDRAKRIAFARDIKTGKLSGIRVEDVIKAVNDIFDENKNLPHEFALNEFKKEFIDEVHKQQKQKLN